MSGSNFMYIRPFVRVFCASHSHSRFPNVTSRGLHRGSDDRAIFSRLPTPGPLSRNEHRLQGRVQINIKLNYNDSVYRGATHSRALAAPAAAIRNGWHEPCTTAPLVIFYAMYINTAMPRPRAPACTCSLVAAFTLSWARMQAAHRRVASSRRQYLGKVSLCCNHHYESIASTRREKARGKCKEYSALYFCEINSFYLIELICADIFKLTLPVCLCPPFSCQVLNWPI